MKILPVGAELFHVEGRTGRQADKQAGRQIDRQTNKYDEANNRFAQFYELA